MNIGRGIIFVLMVSDGDPRTIPVDVEYIREDTTLEIIDMEIPWDYLKTMNSIEVEEVLRQTRRRLERKVL